MNDCRVRDRQRSHRFPVDDDMVGLHRQTSECAAHCQHTRLINVEPLNLSDRCGAKSPRKSAFLNSTDELLTFLRSQRFGIIHTADGAHIGGHYYSACNDGSCDWAAAYFIDAREKRSALGAQIFLDVRPAFQTIRGAAFGSGLF